MSDEVFEVSEQNFELLKRLEEKQVNIIVNLPITLKLYDNFTLLAPAVWEILIPEEIIKKVTEFKRFYDFILVPGELFKNCERYKIKTVIQSPNAQMEVFTLPAELALIYTIRDISIPHVFIALGILQKCNIEQLCYLIAKFYQSLENVVNFLLELATIPLYRSDKLWEIITKYQYQEVLGRMSLYVRDFIKNEYLYEKIM